MTKTDSNRPRVVLVGPVFPFRGGIAQHTTFVARELDRICDLHTISFRRLYPRFLYPGESDQDPQSPDAALRSKEYSLDSINPFSWFRTIRKIRERAPDLVIIPNWTFFLAPCLGVIARGCQRAGIEVRIICHNANDHEASRWKRSLLRWARKTADAMIAQSTADKEYLQGIHPGMPVSSFPHPIHSEFPDPAGELPRRAQVELLFFGFVRPYKGLDLLIAALPHLHGLDWRLSVVGEFWRGREETVAAIEGLGVSDRVELVDRYVSDAEVAQFFSRADMVVLPYRDATGSGVVPLAYRYGKPVLASRLGGLSDLVDDGVTGLLVPPEDPRAIAEAIRKLAASDHGFASAIDRKKAELSWARLAAHVISTPNAEDGESARRSVGVHA